MSASGSFVKSVIKKTDLQEGQAVVFLGKHPFCQSLFVEIFDQGTHTLTRYNMNLRHVPGAVSVGILKTKEQDRQAMERLALNDDIQDTVGTKQFFSLGNYRQNQDYNEVIISTAKAKDLVFALDAKGSVSLGEANNYFGQHLEKYKNHEEQPSACTIS